jgi:TorA maturation chaperone TorD
MESEAVMARMASGGEEFDLAVNMARQAAYRFAALALLDPRNGSWLQLRSLRSDATLDQAAALLRALPQAQPAELAPGELASEHLDPARVLRLLPQSAPWHNAEYERTFGLLVSSSCPPYEIEYINSKLDFQRSNGLADISGFYRAFGLEIAQQHPERADHIVLELEFMAFLAGLERAADGGRDRDAERREICRAAQTRFLREHLAWWAPALGKLLVHHSPEGYYGAVGRFLAALVPVERALLGVQVHEQRPTPSLTEPLEACEGCQLA